MNRSSHPPSRSSDATLQFGKKNAVFALAGVVALVAGYALLAQGSITLAPLLLTLGYIVLIPLAVLG
ncbi:MAG: hypothetical protein RQ745_07135 [Longimicrobiales bacterium]|nr:hypothetical protein [Longimicrobiales bacterium]